MPSGARTGWTGANRTWRKHPELGRLTIRQFESGCKSDARRDDFAGCARALEAAGVEFIDENGGGAGVRLRKPSKKHQD